MKFTIATLFRGQKEVTGNQTNKMNVTPAITDYGDPSSKRQGETYANWGKRICATTSGSDVALGAFLGNVYNYIKREQLEDEAYQAQQKRKIESEIQKHNNDKDFAEDTIRSKENAIEENNDTINAKQNEKMRLRQEGKKKNKSYVLQRAIGLVILIPLTIYLFFFYSSTFYSAFFTDPGDVTTASSAMFNPEAFKLAWNHSFWTLFLILVFPIIFLGLGFGLHNYSKTKGAGKFLKMAAIVTVTFLFDCILAYKIGDSLHEWQFLNGIIDEKAYPVSEAVKDVNTWAVIFCGFIAYIIWGVVFDQTMDAHEKIDSNKIAIEKIDEDIDTLNQQTNKLKSDIEAQKAIIKDIKNAIADLDAKILVGKWFDVNKIDTEMNNFYSGWVAQMGLLGKTPAEQKAAKEEYEKSRSILI